MTASIELLLFEITPSQAINLMQLIFIYPNLCMDLMNSDGVFLICAACYKFCREFSLYKFHDILFVYHIQILLSIFTSVFFNFYLNKVSLKPYKFQYCIYTRSIICLLCCEKANTLTKIQKENCNNSYGVSYQ